MLVPSSAFRFSQVSQTSTPYASTVFFSRPSFNPRINRPSDSFYKLSSSVESTDIVKVNENSSLLGKMKASAQIMYKFSRPHTIKGTILASFMGVLRALYENPTKIQLSLIPRAIFGLVALLCGNAYIVGLNQIYDVKIDEINKPFLPIAAKILSAKNAWILVMACLIAGVSVVKTQFSPQIFMLYMTGVVLGTLYSVPPVQLKRIPICAGTIIAFVRGFLLNVGVYYAVREALGVAFQWNPVVIFVASFMTIFASVIAITKDLPDVEGDLKYNIETLASKYGPTRTAAGASAVLSLAYVVAIALPFILRHSSFKKAPMVIGHSLYLAYFVRAYSDLDAENVTSLKKFYKSIW
eukprot:CAMPEP_0174997486 /NCGR_PEP_ID=MMETSP0005-20121125/979_1 /TAXON_ID=420556 /ORGANISM="Ochromonas sp., Strain CCMP1393" /LENGTH=352 /DNA_ID=CAMNT_0016252015 /DNA_START=45 /DNA_END=1100 /DNA_ORIENTATION=-